MIRRRTPPGAAAACRSCSPVSFSVLAAPVTADRADADGAAGRPTPVDVYLPAGRWGDLYSGQVVDGGRTITRETSLDEFPLYLRAGAEIGFNTRALGGRRTGELTRPGLSGSLYAPEPGHTVRLRVSGATEQQTVVLLRRAPRSVTVAGRALPHAAGTEALRTAREGWTFTSGPFGGVVLKPTPTAAPRT